MITEKRLSKRWWKKEYTDFEGTKEDWEILLNELMNGEKISSNSEPF